MNINETTKPLYFARPNNLLKSKETAVIIIQQRWRKILEKRAFAANILKKAILWSNSAHIIQRNWRQRNMSPQERNEARFKRTAATWLTHSQFVHFYQPTGKILGGGGQGYVTEGIDRSNQMQVAIKVGIRSPYLASCFAKLYARINAALKTTPHLTRIYAVYQGNYYRVKNPDLTESLIPIAKSNPPVFYNSVVNTRFLENSYTIPLTVMELLDGDMEEKIKLLKTPEVLFQISWTEWVIKEKHGLLRGDPKARNTFYKKLSKEDTFRGKKLIEYDYWKYHAQNHDYYIPKPDILIKFGDYDDWRVYDNPNHEEENFLSILISDSHISSCDIERFKLRPKNPNATILEINQ